MPTHTSPTITHLPDVTSVYAACQAVASGELAPGRYALGDWATIIDITEAGTWVDVTADTPAANTSACRWCRHNAHTPGRCTRSAAGVRCSCDEPEAGHAGALVTVLVLVGMLVQLALMGAARAPHADAAPAPVCRMVVTDADHVVPPSARWYANLTDTPWVWPAGADYSPDSATGLGVTYSPTGQPIGWSQYEDAIVWSSAQCARTQPVYVDGSYLGDLAEAVPCRRLPASRTEGATRVDDTLTADQGNYRWVRAGRVVAWGMVGYSGVYNGPDCAR